MTAIVGVWVRGKGAVIASDGRLSDTEGTIHSDREIKVVRCSWGLLAVSGDIQALPSLARARTMQDAYELPVPGLEYNAIAYDGSGLYSWDHTRSVIRVREHCAEGCGGSIALGALEVGDKVRSLASAAVKARLAVKAAIRRNVGCGGKVRVLRMRGT